ncbi:PREDICTED: uncharacterized protein LOC107328446 [Acropora digitifera]|uniref:uncharacterized protein LOC107328446 n=1 Tax=Acropora digitifera TaxID=70779 RepID=UPI00077A4952|nr:PREDICTED: uncharacterized protein LOC107328446 [Acropora digitifera]
MTGDWSRLSGPVYKAVQEELWVIGQVVLRGGRIVMREILWKQTIVRAHEGHQAMVRSKARLREKVWWPGMNKQVEEVVGACHPRQLVGPRAKPEPVKSTRLPEGPWKEISIDLLDVSSGEHLLQRNSALISLGYLHNFFRGCTTCPISNWSLISFCICYYAQIAGDDYCEPWDAKPVRSADTADYWDPCDKIPTAPPPVRKSSKDDYIDPYDAKKDVSSQGGVVKVVKKRPTKPPSREQEVDEDNEDSYDDPYDTGKVTLLDEQSKRLSIRGMRIPSVEGHQLTERDEKRGRMNIDKAQSPSRDQRPADDYDTPWESKSPFGIKQMSPSANKDKPQAPSSDNRPADDYEKPWEWNKKSPLNGHLQPVKPLDSHQSPKADARPAEDYDAPWEWSKSKNVGGMVPSKEGDVKGAVAPKKPPRTFADQQTAIDPTLPLEQQG